MNGARMWSILLGLMGLSALVLGIKINSDFGARLAADVEGKMIFASWHVVTDLMGAVLAGVAGIMAAWKWRWRAAAVGIAATCFAAYSISALIGYGWAHRTAVETATTVNMSRQQKALERSVDMREQQTQWLRSVATTRESDRKRQEQARPERTLALEKSTELASKPVTWERVDPRDLIGDAHSGAISAMTGLSDERAKHVLVIASAVLLITAKLLGFGISPVLWIQGGRISRPRDGGGDGGEKLYLVTEEVPGDAEVASVRAARSRAEKVMASERAAGGPQDVPPKPPAKAPAPSSPGGDNIVRLDGNRKTPGGLFADHQEVPEVAGNITGNITGNFMTTGHDVFGEQRSGLHRRDETVMTTGSEVFRSTAERMVREWLEACDASSRSTPMQASAAYRRFVVWAKEIEAEMYPSQIAFGRALKTMGYVATKSGGRVLYSMRRAA